MHEKRQALPDASRDPPLVIDRWRRLGRPAWLYLAHMALLTCGLAVTSLLFNLAILALGYERQFLGLLNTVGVAVAGLLSLPLWWLASRVGLRSALLLSGAVHAASTLTIALLPLSLPLLVAAALTGVAQVLFQVTASPFMMRHSDGATRDTLFSTSAAVNVGFGGLGSLLGGFLPGLLAVPLGVGAESGLAYRATFAVAACCLLLALLPLLLMRRDDAPRALLPVSAAPGKTQATLGVAWHWPLRRLPEPWRSMVQRPWPLVQLLIPPVLISFGAALLIPYLNLFFKERFGSADNALGAIFAALGIVTGLAALGGPLLSARLGTIRTVALTQLLSIPFLLMLGFVPLLPLAVGALLLRGMLFNMGAPLYDAFAMERSQPAERPTVIGLINAAYASGYVVAPAFSVAVQERFGFGPLILATASCYGAAVLATWWFFVRGPSAAG